MRRLLVHQFFSSQISVRNPVVRRGKNSTKATVAKHATPQEYRASTALESLFGWLYLQNRGARIEELFDVIWNALAPGFALQAE